MTAQPTTQPEPTEQPEQSEVPASGRPLPLLFADVAERVASLLAAAGIPEEVVTVDLCRMSDRGSWSSESWWTVNLHDVPSGRMDALRSQLSHDHRTYTAPGAQGSWRGLKITAFRKIEPRS